MTILASETGHIGDLVALSGIKGYPMRGRNYSGQSFLVTAAALVLSANIQRISALLINLSGGVIFLYIGNPVSAPSIPLIQYGSFQIDSNFPWIGEVYASAGGTGETVLVHEVSIP